MKNSPDIGCVFWQDGHVIARTLDWPLKRKKRLGRTGFSARCRTPPDRSFFLGDFPLEIRPRPMVKMVLLPPPPPATSALGKKGGKDSNGKPPRLTKEKKDGEGEKRQDVRS